MTPRHESRTSGCGVGLESQSAGWIDLTWQARHGVNLWQEKEQERHRMVEQQCHRQKKDSNKGPFGRKVGSNEGQPDNQGCWHAHGDESRLVEIVREFSGLEGEEGA